MPSEYLKQKLWFSPATLYKFTNQKTFVWYNEYVTIFKMKAF
jgi:hypothetical protein